MRCGRRTVAASQPCTIPRMNLPTPTLLGRLRRLTTDLGRLWLLTV